MYLVILRFCPILIEIPSWMAYLPARPEEAKPARRSLVDSTPAKDLTA
jgi:hypothetical protein